MKSSQSNPPSLKRARASLLALLFALFALSAWASTAFAAVPDSEYQLLRAIYNGTNGAQWTNNDGWLQNNAADVCNWSSITCNASGTHVTRINLRENRLNGALPSSLAGLPELELFDVNSNQLTGSIPAIAGLVKLDTFNVGANRLSGALPALQNLPKLDSFYVYNNFLRGRIPDLSGAPLLRDFLAEDNALTGTIPPLATLTQLSRFSVYNNQLTGSLPPLSGLSVLQIFRVENNQLSGALPTPPGNLLSGQSRLCLNQFTDSQSNAWNIAVTGSAATSWNTNCIPVRNQLLLSFGTPPVLTPGGFGDVSATVSPVLGTQPTLFASLTPSVCTVTVAQIGLIQVSPNARAGDVCTITADHAGDGENNSAPQVQQDIVIAAAEPSVVNQVPTLSPWAMLGLAVWLASMGVIGFRRTH
jgi:hypothetical protein